MAKSLFDFFSFKTFEEGMVQLKEARKVRDEMHGSIYKAEMSHTCSEVAAMTAAMGESMFLSFDTYEDGIKILKQACMLRDSMVANRKTEMTKTCCDIANAVATKGRGRNHEINDILGDGNFI